MLTRMNHRRRRSFPSLSYGVTAAVGESLPGHFFIIIFIEAEN